MCFLPKKAQNGQKWPKIGSKTAKKCIFSKVTNTIEKRWKTLKNIYLGLF
jgi:hypothetical protein